MPPTPKPASVRRGHRSKSGTKTLSEVENPVIPELPDYVAWHPAVRDFWESAWSSPMPQEWMESDRHNVLMAARAIQTAWDPETTATARSAAMAEARLLLRECGLTPMARRTLQIEVARAEDATERRQTRKSTAAPKAGGADPRKGLHAV